MKEHYFFTSFYFFLLTLGPALLHGHSMFLYGHSMLEIQGDVFLFGGQFHGGGYNSAIYQLTCYSGICSWATLNQALTVGRGNLVAIPVPDPFCT